MKVAVSVCVSEAYVAGSGVSGRMLTFVSL
jgi:hypothetical protein